MALFTSKCGFVFISLSLNAADMVEDQRGLGRKDLLFFPSQIRMSQLEVKEKELNKLKQESDQLVLNQHPASDKIEVGFLRSTLLLGVKRDTFHKARLYK